MKCYLMNKNKKVALIEYNTTDGMLQKAWVIENGKRKLVKELIY